MRRFFFVSFSAVSTILTVLGLQLVDCCLGCCYHGNTAIVATAAEIYAGIISLKWKGKANCVLLLAVSWKGNWRVQVLSEQYSWLP